MTRRGVYQLELVAALTLVGGVCLVAILAALGRERPTGGDWKPAGPGVASVPAKQRESIHYVGIAAGGCAAANCHGGQNDNAQPGNEWKTSAFDFLQHDPHAQAYNVLFEERSRQMIDRLARGDEALATGKITPPGDWSDVLWYAAQLEKRCVSCHATPLPASAANTTGGILNDYALGVTCEACHGPASRWGDEHLSARWQTNSKEGIGNPINKASTGFNELESLSVAAATCTKCHIGDGEQIDGKSYREVTHDLIAAGHPRLDFDFAAWYASMPAHWNREREKREGFNTEAWAYGQAEALKTRLQLARYPFENSSPPGAQALGSQLSVELANYDCFACHQSLRFPPREPVERPRQTNGLPFGNEWNAFTHVYPAARLENQDLSMLLNGERPPPPEDPNPALKILDALTTTQRLTACPPYENWDELLSWYYAADAVSRDAAFAAQSSPDLAEPAGTMETRLRDLKSEMEKYLARSSEVSRYASPSGFGAAKLETGDSEKPDPQAVQTAFEEAKETLRTLAEKWEH